MTQKSETAGNRTPNVEQSVAYSTILNSTSNGKTATGSNNPVVQFVEWIRPYKEIAILIGTASACISGAVSWAVTHFATLEELSNLECRMSVNVNIQALPIRSSVLSVK